jgi:hypothetical protein
LRTRSAARHLAAWRLGIGAAAPFKTAPLEARYAPDNGLIM